jgi:hypothetical protein
VLEDATPLNYLLYMAITFKSEMSFFQEQKQFLVNTIGVEELEVRRRQLRIVGYASVGNTSACLKEHRSLIDASQPI